MGNQSDSKNETKKEYIWIDPQIESMQNKSHYKNLFTDKKINCEKFNNIDQAYDYLTEKKNYFKEIVIIISGKFLTNFYYKIKNNIDKINFSATIIVFTSNADFTINNLKMNNIYYNNYLLDKQLIFTNPTEIRDFIDDDKKEYNDLTFDIIDNIAQLIIPNYYYYFLEDVNYTEIFYFNSYLKKILSPPTEEEIKEFEKADNNKLIQLHGNELAQKLLNQI